MDPECKNDREAKIKLILSFKKTLLNFISKKNISNEKLKLDESYNDLKKIYEEVEEKVIDPDFYFCNLGENFNFLPKFK